MSCVRCHAMSCTYMCSVRVTTVTTVTWYVRYVCVYVFTCAVWCSFGVRCCHVHARPRALNICPELS